jgi:UDP-N-acetylglucosamine/UDP-N-acetylgalactosamine diphosphorylase
VKNFQCSNKTSSIQFGETLAFLEGKKQHHILSHYRKLSSQDQKVFLAEMGRLDLNLSFALYEKFSRKKQSAPEFRDLHPAPVIPICRTPEEKRNWEESYRLGESLICKNRVACLVVAGGQGTRLGFSGPKGKFPVSPVKKKPLFQIFAESLRALTVRCRATIPLLVMTSRENEGETREFFESSRFFGLERENVHFFCQGMLPSLSAEGKLILKNSKELVANPDGHGGSLKALYESGLLQSLQEKGYTELFYFQVDNPLVRIADPAFIGFHCREGADISTKVVRRQNLEEKVGIYGMAEGKTCIVEYSDLRPEDYLAVDHGGNLRHWAGNIAIHMISLSFIERLNRRGFALPYHRAVKEVECLGPDGKQAKMPAWKFETFVFDSIPLARKSCCVEVRREEEFAPVKNRSGVDSPETARRAMNALFKSWLREAGAEISPEAVVEISPLFALNKEELAEKLKGKKLIIRHDRYME